MVPISVYTRRPVQFWPGKPLRLPGLVDLIKLSAAELTFYKKNNKDITIMRQISQSALKEFKFCTFHLSIINSHNKNTDIRNSTGFQECCVILCC